MDIVDRRYRWVKEEQNKGYPNSEKMENNFKWCGQNKTERKGDSWAKPKEDKL